MCQQQERASLADETSTLRDQNFDLQNRVRSLESSYKQSENQSEERDKQLKLLTDQVILLFKYTFHNSKKYFFFLNLFFYVA